MTREEVEQKIREVFVTETTAIRLSNALFTPNGLFSHLAANEAERRVLVTTPLFREAQRRLSDLQRSEAAEFARDVAQYRSAHGDPVLHKLETSTSHGA